MISQIASKPDAKRVTLPKTLKAESVGYFEAGRRGQKRSLLGVNEHFAHKPDAKRVTLPKTLKAESVGYFEAGRRGRKRSILERM